MNQPRRILGRAAWCGCLTGVGLALLSCGESGESRSTAGAASRVAAVESDTPSVTGAELGRPPRVLYQPAPAMTEEMRVVAPGMVAVSFVVNSRGIVEDPVVQSSSDPIFDAAALAAVRQWTFEPGVRNGQPSSFRMRVPISFRTGAQP